MNEARDVRIPHRLGREAARERIARLAERHGVALESGDGYRGTLQKPLPLLGLAKAQFEIEETELVVRIVQAPPFPSLDTIRRRVAEELGKVLG